MDEKDIADIVGAVTQHLSKNETLQKLGSSVGTLTGQMEGVQTALKTLTDDNRNAFSKIDMLSDKVDKKNEKMDHKIDSIHVKIDGLHCLKEKEIDNIAECVKSNSKHIGQIEKDISGKTGFAKGINWTVVVLGGLFLTIAGIVVAMIFY